MYNAFQVLVNDGFLHDQGILTLEAVQKFYDQILERPRGAWLKEEKFLDFCLSDNDEVQPVVTLSLKNSDEEQNNYHAVTLKHAVFKDPILKTTFIDSRSQIGEVDMYLSLSTDRSNLKPTEKFAIFDTRIIEDWWLGDDMCYYLEFN